MSTHGPIEDEYAKQMNALAMFLDDYLNSGGLPKKVGFALLIYEFGAAQGARMNYIGNGHREDVLIALKELVARWEGNDPAPGRA